MDSNRLQVYGERVRPRIATPLDHYINAFALWFQGMWPAWLAVGACVVIIVAAVAIHRVRMKAHARVPHYRRTESGPIPVHRQGGAPLVEQSRSRRS
ncbi:hypothetical protein BH11ACT4_BH11ACT4_13920 [soil metagenome]